MIDNGYCDWEISKKLKQVYVSGLMINDHAVIGLMIHKEKKQKEEIKICNSNREQFIKTLLESIKQDDNPQHNIYEYILGKWTESLDKMKKPSKKPF